MSTSDGSIADLRRDIETLETRLRADMSIAEHRQGLTISTIQDATDNFRDEFGPMIRSMKKDVDRVTALANRPWYKTPAFWGGMSLIPVIIAGGWLFAVFKDPSVMRLIHKGFGTELAVTAAIKDSDATLQSETAKALAGRISAGQEALTTAIDTRVGQSYLHRDKVEAFLANKISTGFEDIPSAIGNAVLKQEGFDQLLTEKVDTRFQTFHLALLDLGIVDPQKLLDSGGDIDFDALDEEQVTTVFSAPRDTEIVIQVGLAASSIDRDAVEAFNASEDPEEQEALLGRIEDVYYRPVLSEVLTAHIGKDEIVFEDDDSDYYHTIDGRREAFASYSSDPINTNTLKNREDFPLQTLSFKSASTEPFTARLIVIVKRKKNE